MGFFDRLGKRESDVLDQLPGTAVHYKKAIARDAARRAMGEAAVADQQIEDRVHAARLKQARAREAVQTVLSTDAFDGAISAGGLKLDRAEPPLAAGGPSKLSAGQLRSALGEAPAPSGSGPDAAPADSAPGVQAAPGTAIGKHLVGPGRSLPDFVAQSMASGSRLLDGNGKPVIETKDALIAPASLMMTDAQRRERVEAMLTHAAQKFPAQPLRLDGNEKFMTMAIEAALARGLTVEVPEKHRQLLEKLTQQVEQKSTAAPQIDGVISPSLARTAEVNLATSDKDKPVQVTGKLLSVDPQPNERGMIKATIQRAGSEHAVWVPGSGSDSLKPLLGKTVRFEPGGKDGAPARLVGLKQQRGQAKEHERDLGC